MKLSFHRATALIALLLNSASVFATTIDNVSGWSGSGVFNFGEDNSGVKVDSGVYSTYGQTFRLNSSDDTLLQSISFYVNDSWTLQNPIDFAIYLYQWDGTRIVGNALFESLPLATTQASSYELFNVSTGGVQMAHDTNYVVFMSASNFFDGNVGYGGVGITSNTYLNGKFVYMNNKNDFSKLLAGPWGSNELGDLAFKLELTSATVPEPSSLLLLMTGLTAIPWLRRNM